LCELLGLEPVPRDQAQRREEPCLLPIEEGLELHDATVGEGGRLIVLRSEMDPAFVHLAS
jgi:hypothetical protein